ncbi:dihydropyrimidinase [Komagataeibacter diospyri]|uniref:amidohydrolase family protein n=1 Tax=Komagataeibacter diospyri TaxID=1932662 RepID=UPI001134B9C1|nr:amidohydrolase family protein [Komagataeibacter diospyri]GCE91784.1 dihydropyrimidinase [Komagataeibacter diospyri]
MGMRHGQTRDLLLIRGGTVVTGQASLRVDVLCGGVGEILAVGPDLDIPPSCTVVDAGGLLVMPGGVDPQTGIGADEAGFALTAAALSGGTTTILDTMHPDSGRLDGAWRDWQHAARHAHVDVGLHMALPDSSTAVLRQMDSLVTDQGINAFHLSMPEGLSDRDILKLTSHAANCGALCMIEAQNAQAVAYLRAELDHAGITGGEACLLSAPPQVEAEAVGRAIMLAGLSGGPVHVGPVSTIGATEVLAQARLRGQRVEGHVLAPHLVVDEAVHDPEGDAATDFCITLPPFRDGTHRRALWGGLASGTIGMVASGFRPAGTGGNGVVDGLAQRMRVVWLHGVRAGILTAEEFVAVTSQAAARAFNIYPRKGAIMPGADADIVLWDPDAQETCTSGLYAGITLGGRAVQVIRGGVTVWKDDMPCEGAGYGAYVPCPAFRPRLSERMRMAAHLSMRDDEI